MSTHGTTSSDSEQILLCTRFGQQLTKKEKDVTNIQKILVIVLAVLSLFGLYRLIAHLKD